jgi:hypothetical protein
VEASSAWAEARNNANSSAGAKAFTRRLLFKSVSRSRQAPGSFQFSRHSPDSHLFQPATVEHFWQACIDAARSDLVMARANSSPSPQEYCVSHHRDAILPWFAANALRARFPSRKKSPSDRESEQRHATPRSLSSPLK